MLFHPGSIFTHLECRWKEWDEMFNLYMIEATQIIKGTQNDKMPKSLLLNYLFMLFLRKCKQCNWKIIFFWHKNQIILIYMQNHISLFCNDWFLRPCFAKNPMSCIYLSKKYCEVLSWILQTKVLCLFAYGLQSKQTHFNGSISHDKQ